MTKNEVVGGFIPYRRIVLADSEVIQFWVFCQTRVSSRYGGGDGGGVASRSRVDDEGLDFSFKKASWVSGVAIARTTPPTNVWPT